MRGPFRALGHPVHAMLSDFPMVFLLTWAALDSAAVFAHSPGVWSLGRWALIAGLVAAGVAALFGFIDYFALAQTESAATRTATAHMATNLTAVCIALVVLLYRGPELPAGFGRALHLAAAWVVAACLLAGGWLGGHLVFHHGVGHDGP